MHAMQVNPTSNYSDSSNTQRSRDSSEQSTVRPTGSLLILTTMTHRAAHSNRNMLNSRRVYIFDIPVEIIPIEELWSIDYYI